MALAVGFAVVISLKLLFSAATPHTLPSNIEIRGNSVTIDFAMTHIAADMGSASKDCFILHDGLGEETEAANAMLLTSTMDQLKEVGEAVALYGECDIMTNEIKSHSFTRVVMFAANENVAGKIKMLLHRLKYNPVIELTGRRLNIKEHTFEKRERVSPRTPEIIYLVDDVRIVRETAKK